MGLEFREGRKRVRSIIPERDGRERKLWDRKSG